MDTRTLDATRAALLGSPGPPAAAVAVWPRCLACGAPADVDLVALDVAWCTPCLTVLNGRQEPEADEVRTANIDRAGGIRRTG